MDPLTRFWSLFGLTLHLERMTPYTVLALYVVSLIIAVLVVVFAIDAIGRVFSPVYWRRGDSWIAALNLLLLVAVFLLRDGTGSQALRELGADLLHRFFPDLVPRAIVAEWLLLCVFWFAFGVLLRMRLRVLLTPVEYLAVSLGRGALYVAFAVCWYKVCVDHGLAARLSWVLVLAVVFLALGYALLLSAGNPYARSVRQQGERTRRQYTESQLARGGSNWMGRWQQWWSRHPEPPERGWRWRYGAAELRAYLLRYTLAVVFVVVMVTLPFALGAARTPAPASVVRAVLLVYLFGLVAFFFSFSRGAYDIPQVPSALPRLVQFTTTLGAFVLVVVGTARSARHWPEPVLLATLAAPLIAALAVFFVRVLPVRRSTARWGVLVGTAVLLAICLLPLNPALAGFASVVVDGSAHRV